MKNKFTLIEVVAVIVVLSILASIVLIKVSDFKDKAIHSAIASNTKILQTSVDTFYLHNERYPIANENGLNIERPQLIEINKLKEEGYLKKELDTSRIKDQYYWVDVFGRIWGSTIQPPKDVVMISNSSNGLLMEFTANKKVEGIDVYETIGYNSVSKNAEKENLFADLNPKSENVYKLISNILKKGNKEERVSLNLPSKGSNYLVSVIDKYGLEAAPIGKFNKGSLLDKAIRGEGVYNFEISGEELMYWDDLVAISDIPEGTSITYRFKVLDENGELTDWQDDFFALDPSLKIIVEVEMKGDGKGEYPTLYDLRILFHYKEETFLKPNEEKCTIKCYSATATCPNPTEVSTVSSIGSGADENKQGYVVVPFYIGNGVPEKIAELLGIRTGLYASHKVIGMEYFIFDGITYSKTTDLDKTYLEKCGFAKIKVQFNEILIDLPNPALTCGSGGTESTYYGNKRVLVLKYFIPNERYIKRINVRNDFYGYEILNISLEQSLSGGPYEQINSISEVQPNGCLNFIYHLEKIATFGPQPKPPTDPEIIVCKINCSPPLCKGNCIPQEGEKCLINCDSINECKEDDCDGLVEKCEEICNPEPPCEDECLPVKEDPEWETIESLRFLASGPTNRDIRWYNAIIEDTIYNKEDTRIVYNFAKGNRNGNWSTLYEEFSKVGVSHSVMAVAFIQVRIAGKDNVTVDQYPKVDSIIFESELGDSPANMTNPSLVITAEKDNNIGRDVYSNSSKIKWDTVVADPRNLKIKNIEWDGDIREQYPVGVYEIKAKATNERGYSSEWVVFTLTVKEEQPMAVIDMITSGSPQFPNVKDKLDFSLKNSYDPDGDKIVNYEWVNKKDSYPIGTHTVKLRVQDEEGYWSDWTEKTLSIGDKGYKIYRIEAEVKDASDLVESVGSSNKETVSIYSGRQVLFKFEGTGFDLMVSNDYALAYIDDSNQGIPLVGGLNSIRNLKETSHTILVTSKSNYVTNVDYLDAYSPNDKVTLSNLSSRMVTNGVVGPKEERIFSSKLNQSLRLTYLMDKDSTEKVTIADSSGNIVKTISNSAQLGGTYRNKTVSWNGLNDNGETAPNGTYYFKFELTGVNNTKSTFTYEISLQNLVPIMRIEAESLDGNEVERNGSISRSTIYSGGQGISMYNIGAYVTFKFTGTGFDLALPSNSMNVYIDGSTVPTVAPSKTLFSIRNLENKEHTVRVTPYNNGSTVADYLDVYAIEDEVNVFDIKSTLTTDNVHSPILQNTLNLNLKQTMTINYKLDKDSKEKLSIIDSTGNTIKWISETEQKGGSYKQKSITWDGKDENGNYVKVGEYRLKIETVGVYGTKSSKTYKINVMDVTPTSRIEAEYTIAGKVINSSGKTSRNSSYSGGYAAYIDTRGAYVEFTFAGTGFDLKLGANDVDLYVDEELVAVGIRAGLYTVRGLDNKTHKVKAIKTNSSVSHVDYLDVYK